MRMDLDSKATPVEIRKSFQQNKLNGVFVCTIIDWSTFENLIARKYDFDIDNQIEKDIEEKIGIGERIFPIKKIIRRFNKNESHNFCKLEIFLKTQCLSKKETLNHISEIKKKANENEEWLLPITDWLDIEKGHASYYVVDFEIRSTFNIGKYLEQKSSSNKDSEKSEGRSNFERITNYARWVTEILSEKIGYVELYRAINYSYDRNFDQPIPKPEKQKIPFITYKPQFLSFEVKIKNSEKIEFGKETTANLRIMNKSEDYVSFFDDQYKINIDSKYINENGTDLELKNKQIYFYTDSNPESEYKWDPPEKNQDIIFIPGKKDGKTYFIKLESVKISPKLSEITKEFLEKYPITFSLVEPISFFTNNEKDQPKLDEKKIKLQTITKTITIKAPKIKFSAKRPKLPHKGDQIEVTFYLENLDEHNTDENRIPMRIDCIFGSDFSPIHPMKKAKDSEIVVSDIIEVGSSEKNYTFRLYANRAGYPGYTAKANFLLYLGEWKNPINHWKMDMVVLPNRFDTFVAGVTGILGLLYMYRPDIFPGLTEGINIANLGATPGIIYLAYRALSWAKGTNS